MARVVIFLQSFSVNRWRKQEKKETIEIAQIMPKTISSRIDRRINRSHIVCVAIDLIFKDSHFFYYVYIMFVFFSLPIR